MYPRVNDFVFRETISGIKAFATILMVTCVWLIDHLDQFGIFPIMVGLWGAPDFLYIPLNIFNKDRSLHTITSSCQGLETALMQNRNLKAQQRRQAHLDYYSKFVQGLETALLRSFN